MQHKNGRLGMVSNLQPRNVKSYTLLHPPVPGFSAPLLLGLVTHLCQLRSWRNSSGFGGIRASPSRSTSGCWRPSARRPSILPEWLHTWSGVGQILLMLYWAIVHSKLVYRCIVYGTASNTKTDRCILRQPSVQPVHRGQMGEEAWPNPRPLPLVWK